jgi:hypothetical protein
MRRASAALALFAVALGTGILAVPALAAEEPCSLQPRARCFGIESVEAALSTTQAGAHPDVTFTFDIKKDPESEPNVFGLKDSFAATRNVRIELPPGLSGNPNVLGLSQQCPVEGLVTWASGGGCPNGSQVGLTDIAVYGQNQVFVEPVYMMTPPGGDVVARLGFVAGIFPTFVDLRVRSEDDYGLVADITDASAVAKLIRARTTTWGVPADPSHDTERMTPVESFHGAASSTPRPPGSLPLPFVTNPTRCGVSLEMDVSASSWVIPDLFDEASAPFPPISGCEKLPFGAELSAQPTRRSAAAPTGLDLTIQLPGPDGTNVLEPSEVRDVEVDLPEGVVTNPASADGLATCSVEQVRLERREDAHCPDAAKLATAEFDIPALPRRMKGAIYLREPEPGDPFRIWVVADDLGAHVKLPGELVVDKQTGQISSTVLEVPQFPVRETRLLFKSGFRAPLATPGFCGTFFTHSRFVPWSGTPPIESSAPMSIDEGCDTGRFDPQLSAGTTNATAGLHAPFVFSLTREDGEQNPQRLDISLPAGLAATFVGIPRCEGIAAETGACPPGSRIGKVMADIGTGPKPLRVPQPGKRPTAVYLSGPYHGAPLSIVAVVPRQAGPFDFGDEVVRSAVFVDPITGQATAKADPLPQIIEGIPIYYRMIHVDLDRPGFTLNPTSCAQKQTRAIVTSSRGDLANPTSPFRATDCAKLRFQPKLSLRLSGGTHRGAHPRLKATVWMPEGGANIGGTSVTLPPSEFVENAHFNTICTRVQFAAKACPAGSIYGFALAKTPLLEQPLEGPVYLRSSSHELPDLVMALKGPASMPIEIDLDGQVDSINGRLRTTFEQVPDAPVSEFTLQMQGGRKGLIVNSTNLCAKSNRATAKFTAQNGRSVTLRPEMRSSCKGKSRRGHSPRRDHRQATR